MEIKEENKLTISLTGNEIDTFKNAIEKIVTKCEKVGFRKNEILNEDEIELYKKLQNKL